jgi:hypothetical protein
VLCVMPNFLGERRVAGQEGGLAEATLRLPSSMMPDQVALELQRAFGRLFDLYGNVNFGVRRGGGVGLPKRA